MDGENNGSKPYEQMDDLGGGGFRIIFWKHPYISSNFIGFIFCWVKKNPKKHSQLHLEEAC